MNKELFEQLVQVLDNLQNIAYDVAFECSPKTERKFKKQLKALTTIIKKLAVEELN